MKPAIEFSPWPKIARLSREVIVTEKIDGTNAQVFVDDEGNVFAGSRTRWITPSDDNYGFARWVEDHKDDLVKLGPGHHFGEWWGAGIQRRYGLSEKRFSLFNVSRWADVSLRPACCAVVPEIWRGNFDELPLERIMRGLAELGSWAVSGFMRPEGIVIYHTASGQMFKKTLENDEQPKSKVGA